MASAHDKATNKEMWKGFVLWKCTLI